MNISNEIGYIATMIGGLITVLLSIIGYFVKTMSQGIKQRLDDFADQFSDFRVLLNSIEIRSNDFRELQEKKNDEFATKFNNHSEKLNEHDVEIAKINEVVKLKKDR